MQKYGGCRGLWLEVMVSGMAGRGVRQENSQHSMLLFTCDIRLFGSFCWFQFNFSFGHLVPCWFQFNFFHSAISFDLSDSKQFN